MNKAIGNVSKPAFELLYIINNNCSLQQTNSVEMDNQFLADKMKLKKRQIQNLTKELEEKGFIRKQIQGTETNKKRNIYSLVEVTNDNDSDTLNNRGVKNCTPDSLIEGKGCKKLHGGDAKNCTLKKNTIKNKLNNHNSIQSNVTILAQEETIEVTENVLNQNDNNDNSNNNLNLGFYNDTFSQDDNGNETDITPIEDNYNFSDTADTANTQSKPQEQNKATSEQNTIQNNKTYIPMKENTTQGNYDVIEKRYSEKPQLMSNKQIEFALNDTEAAINIVELNLKEGAHPNTDIPSYTRYINNKLEEVDNGSSFCSVHLSQRFAVLNNRWSELKQTFNLKANQITLPF